MTGINGFSVDREWLSDERVNAITASWPTCPDCGLLPDTVKFVRVSVHKLSFGMDASPSLSDSERTLVDASDNEYDVTAHGPMLRHKLGSNVPPFPTPLVQCENGHEWNEARLQYHEDSGRWTLLPPPPEQLPMVTEK